MLLAQQIATWEAWHDEKAAARQGALQSWERELLKWDHCDTLDGELWGHLQHWARNRT